MNTRGQALSFTLALAVMFSACAVQRRQMGRFAHFAGYKLFHASPKEDCWDDAGWKACVFRPKKGPPPKDLVYFMHYATGNEYGFGSIGLAHAFFAELSKMPEPPAVVSVSFGSHWLLTRGKEGRQIVPLEKFTDVVMPEVERRVGIPRHRGVWGMSMGGFNALQLAMARPDDFDAAVLSCPALHAVDPLLHEKEAAGLAQRSGAPLKWADDGMALFYHRIPDDAAWKKEDPLARLSAGAPVPRVLIQANRGDEYAFFEGAEAYAAALKKAGRPVEFSPVGGGHCVVDAREAARFLTSVR